MKQIRKESGHKSYSKEEDERNTHAKDSFYLQIQITYCLDHKQRLDSFSTDQILYPNNTYD